jgi:hypothetical protein
VSPNGAPDFTYAGPGLSLSQPVSELLSKS